jgi:hypothetical protein
MTTSEFKNTGEKIKYNNGKVFSVYSKLTKKGIRYYTWSYGRMFPISKDRINELILID